jgi:hypothetical protein
MTSEGRNLPRVINRTKTRFVNCRSRGGRAPRYVRLASDARLAHSLPTIELDFEGEIARIMSDTALRKTGKSLQYQLI